MELNSNFQVRNEARVLRGLIMANSELAIFKSILRPFHM